MVSPDSQATACLPSGRNSTYRPVQISGTGSNPGCSSDIGATLATLIAAGTGLVGMQNDQGLRARDLAAPRRPSDAAVFGPEHFPEKLDSGFPEGKCGHDRI
jgi:hypothetical protein